MMASSKTTWLWERRALILGPLLFLALCLAGNALLYMRLRALLVSLSPAPELLGALQAFFAVNVVIILLLTLTYALLEMHRFALIMRQQADTDRTSFVRMAADTLRTPLTGLRWTTELFLGEDLGTVNEAQRQSIDSMGRSIRRLIKLVNELLDVMKLSGGIIRYHPVSYDVNVLANAVIADVRELASTKLQTLAYGELSKDNMLELDPPLIRHLLSTLLINVVHLSAVRSTIVLHGEPDADHLSIGITYEGAVLDFKPVGNDVPGVVPSAAVDAGSFDLTVCWEILQAAQGKFWVREVPEKPGAHTLFVTLPLHPAERKHASPLEPAAAAA